MGRKKFLVPVDVDHDSSDLLRFAADIAKNIQGRISCVSVMPERAVKVNSMKGLQLRRNVELELAKVATEVFTKRRSEFDIIVTKGDFVQRILSMTKELEIDLIVTKVLELSELKRLHAELEIPIIFLNNNPEKINELVLPVNLDKSDYQKIPGSIHVAALLNVQIKVIAYTALQANEYKEKLNNMKNIIEKENIACTISFVKIEEEISILPEDVEISSSESLLLTLNEFQDIFYTEKEPGYQFNSSITLLPSKQKLGKLLAPLKEPSYN